jgi:hypothetical protein
MILSLDSNFPVTAVMEFGGGVGELGLISPQPSAPAVLNRNKAASDLPPRGILKIMLITQQLLRVAEVFDF